MEGHIQAQMENALAEEETSKIGTSLFIIIIIFFFFFEAKEVKLALQTFDTLHTSWTETRTMS